MARNFRLFVVSSTALAVIAGVLLFASGCESEPTPTPTATPVPPAPTATATPEPTPTATAVPELAPTPIPVSIHELEITATTTVREVVAAFSEEEGTCIREAIGADAFNLIADVPVTSLQGGTEDFPIQCLGTESTVGFVVANLSAEAGGLSSETRSCISGIATENPSVLGMGPPPESFGEVIAGAVRIQLCLSDDEAAAWAASQGMELPPPSALQCLEEQVGGEEALLAMLSDEAQAEMAMQNLFTAALACEAGQGQPEVTPIAG